MDCCRNNALARPAPLPLMAPCLTTLKKNQPPAYDAFGPFPDETVLSGIDRVLFMLGARRFQSCACTSPGDEKFGMGGAAPQPQPPQPLACPDEHEPYRIRSTVVTDTKCSPGGHTVRVAKKCCCSKCATCTSRTTLCSERVVPQSPPASSRNCGTPSGCGTPPKATTPRVRISAPPARLSEALVRPPSNLKRSFSLCSLACRKIRQKISFSPPSESASKWLWTRVQCNPEGCEIYEVFRHSNIAQHPSHNSSRLSASPKIIFVVLPNGVIMPFETLSTHK